MPSSKELLARHRRKFKYPSEGVVQQQVKAYLAAQGCVVYDTSQGYRKDPGGTRMTPGIPDLIVWLPNNLSGWVEVKSHDGMLLYDRMLKSPLTVANRSDWMRVQAQERFAQLCHRAGVPHTRGGLAEVTIWMEVVCPK